MNNFERNESGCSDDKCIIRRILHDKKFELNADEELIINAMPVAGCTKFCILIFNFIDPSFINENISKVIKYLEKYSNYIYHLPCFVNNFQHETSCNAFFYFLFDLYKNKKIELQIE